MPPKLPEPSDSLSQPVRGVEKAALLGLLLVILGFGVLVEIRSAFLTVRRTDLGVYLQAARAIRTGGDLYSVTDRDWHYHYPPLFAILLTPLAEAGEDPVGYIPFAVSVAIWYLLSIGATFLAVHWIARALERSSTNPAVRNQKTGCRRWWFARIIPIYLAIAPIGCSLSRGQVNLVLLLLIAGFFAAWSEGKRFRSGLWLAGAICIKIMPAFLLLFPLWKRDGRSLLGVSAGLILGLVLIPSMVMGIGGMWSANLKVIDLVLMPAVTENGDQSRAVELHQLNSTDNQALPAVLHHYEYWNPATRPPHAGPEVRTAHVVIGVLLILATLFAAGWRKRDDAQRDLIFLGALCLLMVILSPMAHTHYFCLAIPLMMGLTGLRFSRKPGMMALLAVVGAAFALTMIPFWEHRREAGFSLIGSLILCLVAIRTLAQKPASGAIAESVQPTARARAA